LSRAVTTVLSSVFEELTNPQGTLYQWKALKHGKETAPGG